jgi:hypothetical protein
MSGNYGSNRFPQYPGDPRRTSGSSSANPSSLNNLSANQSYGNHPEANPNAYLQYNPSGGYSQGLPTQHLTGSSLASTNRDLYARPQYPASHLPPGGLSYNNNPPLQPSGISLDSLYSPITSSSPLLQQNILGGNSTAGLHQESYLSSSIGITCPNPSHNSDSRPSHGVVRNHM